MHSSWSKVPTLVGIILLGLLSFTAAHGNDEDMDMNMAIPVASRPTLVASANATAPATYFNYGEKSGLMLMHILLMTIAWIFILPISVMLSISRSRYTLPTQFLFLAVNGAGVLLATIYNASTPDFYPNNAHHKLGWILTWGVGIQVVLGIIEAYARRKDNQFLPLVVEGMEEDQIDDNEIRRPRVYRLSNDSGQGTVPNTEGLRSQSISSQGSELTLHDVGLDQYIDDDQEEKHGLIHGTRVDKFLTNKLPGMISTRVLGALRFLYNAIDRLVLILGSVALTTGGITYGGFFMGSRVFSGLAHFIKGGVFFWYGILTLGRWAGCFAEIGWAWNNPSKTRAVTAEAVESFLIFFYGSTNIFLEHLAAWGHAWSAQDLEHLSITTMFIGGGLCGMLIESTRIRDLLNTTKQNQRAFNGNSEEIEEPKSYRFPMNPIPALVILLLGLMMSSHHQSSMVATMIHTQWGTLLVGAAFARAASYIIFYLAPPTSFLPGRPPTELITAFCLMSGGMIFMASSRDTVMAMETNDLDAMFIFTVSMGVITFLMAWIIVVIAVKGLVLRKEHKLKSKSVHDSA